MRHLAISARPRLSCWPRLACNRAAHKRTDKRKGGKLRVAADRSLAAG